LPPDTALAFEAMRELRTHLTDADAFARRVDEEQRPQGYRLVGAFEDDGRVTAVAGFRLLHTLLAAAPGSAGCAPRTSYAGDVLYVDDLSTLPEARGRGHAGALLDWCADEGRRLGAHALHLDSGVGPERQDAHRLYFRKRLRISSYHFARPL
jgi:GNAT superfamily N-acetyltransferase